MTSPWLREDATEADHPKVLRLIDAAGYEAYYRLHRLRQWCARHRTDGAFPKGAITEVNAKPKHVAAMVAVGLVERDENGGFRVHDFAIYNPGSTDAERARRYRERKRNA